MKGLRVNNHEGSAWKMEVIGILLIFQFSVHKRQVRYIKYVGDGDTKTFLEITKDQPYGSKVINEKLEFIGHIQKRLKHVKIYDVTSYEVVHTLDYPSPILSVACAPEDKVVVVGMTDGLLSIRHQKSEPNPADVRKKQRQNTFYQYRLYGTDFKPEEGDIIVPEKQKKKLKKYDRYLRTFESSRALDSVLKDIVQRNQPETTISVIMELIRRGSIKAAMAGREGPSLLQLLKFVTRYIGDPRFMRVLTDVGLMLIEIYGPKLNNPAAKKMFEVLLKSVENQVQYMKEMMEIQGAIQTVLAVAHSQNTVEEDLSYNDVISPTKSSNILLS